MKSRAHISGHPLHPILVTFPIAFFIGTLCFDIIVVAGGNREFLQTAYWLNVAGCCGAVIAALPGFIDYLTVVPPHSSAKNRAAKHGLTNTTSLILFAIALYLRSDFIPHGWIVLIESVATVLLLFAGWMGGTLVYRNQIGVDIRYANAGKWIEIELDSSGSAPLALVKDLKENQMALLQGNGKRLVLAKSEGKFYAFDDHCTHRGGSLAAGTMICGTVQCPWHGSQFDIKTGMIKAGPAKEMITTYKVHLEGDRFCVEFK